LTTIVQLGLAIEDDDDEEIEAGPSSAEIPSVDASGDAAEASARMEEVD